MALTRGAFRAFEYNRAVVMFSMLNGQSEIACAISTSAMDELDKATRTRPDQREQQFMRLRDQIEACAERKFENLEFEGTPPGLVLRSIDFR